MTNTPRSGDDDVIAKGHPTERSGVGGKERKGGGGGCFVLRQFALLRRGVHTAFAFVL